MARCLLCCSHAQKRAAEQPHLNNRRWSAATPADVHRHCSTAAEQPHNAGGHGVKKHAWVV
ncbi:MAG: hypothetical protein IJS08_11155 [Victivallales bacterium]|nr:hypothetical protein [Victivallales bacterium]